MKLDPVTLATPFFIITIILEIVLARLGKAKANYDWRDARTSMLMGLGSTVSGLLTGGIVVATTLYIYRFHVFDIPFERLVGVGRDLLPGGLLLLCLPSP